MWPSVRTRLPACFSESFRTTLYLGETEKKKKKKDSSTENVACIVQPEPSASIGINFAAAASSLRDTKLRYVNSYDTTPLSEVISLGDEAHEVIAHTPEKSATDALTCHVTSTCSRTTPLVGSSKQKTTSRLEETKPQIRSRSSSSEEQEVKYSRTLEFLLKTNFELTPTSSSQEILDDRANVSSTKKKVPVKVKEELGLEELLTINAQPKQKSRKSTSQKEIRKARRRELNKVHAKNYREKIKAERDVVSITLSELEEKNAALKKKIRAMEEKKRWLTSHINTATKKKTEALKREQQRQAEEERKQREEERSLSLDIEELFGSVLTSQVSISPYEVMEIE